MRHLCLEAARHAGLTPVGELFHRFTPLVPGGPAGLTGVVLLAESHLAVHTWPERGAVTLDVYVCNAGADHSGRAEQALAALIAGFALPSVVTSKLALSLMAQAIFDALLATSVGFLILQNGRVSFGQAAFFGLGGYIFGVVVARRLLSPELALLLALVAPALVAFLLGLVIARVTGVLENVKQEFYRRYAEPYEDEQIERSGDVY